MSDIPIHPLQEIRPMQFNIERIDHHNSYNPGDYHRHDYFEIFLFREGGGTHYIDFTALPVKAGAVHFVTPGQVHLLDRAPDSSGYVMLFSADFFVLSPENNDFLLKFPLFYHKTGTPALELPAAEFEHLIFYVEAMLREFDSRNSQRQRILQSYLHIFLYRCLHWFETHQPPQGAAVPDLFLQLQAGIEQHFRQWHQVADYARHLFVGARKLNQLSLKYAGKHVAQLIQERLLMEAKRLLRFTEHPVGNIADELGFEDMAHFSRFFKRYEGLSPSAWRQEMSACDKTRA